jgi:hypothetical protein
VTSLNIVQIHRTGTLCRGSHLNFRKPSQIWRERKRHSRIGRDIPPLRGERPTVSSVCVTQGDECMARKFRYTNKNVGKCISNNDSSVCLARQCDPTFEEQTSHQSPTVSESISSIWVKVEAADGKVASHSSVREDSGPNFLI